MITTQLLIYRISYCIWPKWFASSYKYIKWLIERNRLAYAVCFNSLWDMNVEKNMEHYKKIIHTAWTYLLIIIFTGNIAPTSQRRNLAIVTNSLNDLPHLTWRRGYSHYDIDKRRQICYLLETWNLPREQVLNGQQTRLGMQVKRSRTPYVYPFARRRRLDKKLISHKWVVSASLIGQGEQKFQRGKKLIGSLQHQPILLRTIFNYHWPILPELFWHIA